MSTQHSRSRLPFEIKHSDAAAAAAQAALLGAALAGGDSQLHASALHDLLHEPYREADAPLRDLAALEEAMRMAEGFIRRHLRP